MANNEESNSESGSIKQGSVAEFFRKRTQLVGFDFGLNKHTQYAIEFLDNSLDAIETFHWKESKRHPDYAFKLKDDLILENFSYFNPVFEEDIQKMEETLSAALVDDEGNQLSEDGEVIIEAEEGDESLVLDEEEESTEEPSKSELTEDEDEEAKNIRKLQKKAEELEDEVQNIMYGVDGFLFPVKALIEREPFVIIQLTEREAQEVYADISKDAKDVYEYTLDIFDNGTGMSPGDLEKFGKYLASSKSQKLRQTRGSQGFGSPSAFSDAQNTTGQPITVVSKNINHIYATCSQFYTTSKNSKEYIVPPTEVTTVFEHGTYISLSYLNVKYRKGYIDSYVQQTALTNPHITIVYLDPSGEEEIYPRRVKNFPREPTYALPHPSSVNIGDFQDHLRNSTNVTLSAFLQDNFVRLSSSVAKSIINEAEIDLQDSLKLLNVDHGYISWSKNEGNPIYYMRYENRLFGRSKKPREKLAIYEVKSQKDLESYWNVMSQYNKKFESFQKKSRIVYKISKSFNKEEEKSKRTEFKTEISALDKEIALLGKEIEDLNKIIIKITKEFSYSEANEVSEVKITDKLEEDVKELSISKAHPYSLTQKQTESLYKSFKAQKYMAPPSDPAVPIGATILETTMMKEFSLNPSHRTDLFEDEYEPIKCFSEKESNLYLNRILAKFLKPFYLDPEFNKSQFYPEEESIDISLYEEFFQKYDMLHTHEDDFIMGFTRQPTSGKGLAFVVEAVIAISNKIPASKQAQQVVMRYVNRTPKMRDSSDCAIWKGVQSVNWKNYKLDIFDNGIPKGNIRILVNVSGPYVHLMFKSQSKNALAEDEVLLKEIKYCLEAIGRKIRNYENKKVNRENRRKRSKVIEKYIPIFLSSLLQVANKIDDYKHLSSSVLEQRIMDRLEGKIKKSPEEEQQEESSSDDEAAVIQKKTKIKVKKQKPKTDEDAEDEESDEDAEDEESDEDAEDEESDEDAEDEESDEDTKDELLGEDAEDEEFDEDTTKKESDEEIRESAKIKLSPNVSISPRSTEGPKKVRSIDDILKSQTKIQQQASTKEASNSSVVPSDSTTKTKSISSKSSSTSTKKVLSVRGSKQSDLKPSEKNKNTSATTLETPTPKKLVVPKSGSSESAEKITKQPEIPSITKTPHSTQQKLVKPESKTNILTTQRILDRLAADEWYSIKDLIKQLEISDLADARYLQLKLKQLTREKKLLISIRSGKTFWKKN